MNPEMVFFEGGCLRCPLKNRCSAQMMKQVVAEQGMLGMITRGLLRFEIESGVEYVAERPVGNYINRKQIMYYLNYLWFHCPEGLEPILARLVWRQRLGVISPGF